MPQRRGPRKLSAPLRLLAGSLLFAVVATFSSLPAASPAGGKLVYIVVSDASHYYHEVALSIRDYLKYTFPGQTVTVHDKNDLRSLTIAGDPLFICIGTPASRGVLQRFPRQSQLSLFLTRQAWEALSPGELSGEKAELFIDQPPGRLFALGRTVAPRARVFATVLGPASAGEGQQLVAAADAMGVELRSDNLAAASDPLAVLTPLLAGAEVFIPVPDTAPVNRTVAKWALHLAFRHQIPVIGFSRAYTEAGAAASLYTSTGDISRQAIEWLGRYFSEPDFSGWRSYPPKYFTVSANPSVLSTLGLEPQTPEQLHRGVLQHLRDSAP